MTACAIQASDPAGRQSPGSWLNLNERSNMGRVPANALSRARTLGRAPVGRVILTENRSRGRVGTPTYSSWRGMIVRCEQPSQRAYPNYGGRGIRVCERWRGSFDAFLMDMGPRPEGCTLDRIDVNGNYEASNCRWATPKEQSANKRAPIGSLTAHGKTQSAMDWAAETGLSFSVIYKRLRAGCSHEEAVSVTRLPYGRLKRSP